MNSQALNQWTSFQESLKQFLVDSTDAPNPLLMHRIMAALRGELPLVKSQIAFAQLAKQIEAIRDEQQCWLKVLRKLIIVDKLIEEMMFLEEIAGLDVPQIDQWQSNKCMKEVPKTSKLINAFWKLLKSKSTLQCSHDHIFNYRRSQRSVYLQSITAAQILAQIHTIQAHFVNIRQFAQYIEVNSQNEVKRWTKCGSYQYLSLQLLYKFMCAYSCQLQCQQALLSKLQQLSLQKIAQFKRVIAKFRQNCQAFISFINNHSHIRGFEEINADQIKNTTNSQLGMMLDEYSTYREAEISAVPMSPLPSSGQCLGVEKKPMSDMSVQHVAPRLAIKNKTRDINTPQNAFSDWRSSFSCEFPQREIMTIDLIFQLKLQQSEERSDQFYQKQQEGCYEREDISCCSYDNRSTNITSTYEVNLKNYTLKKFDSLPKTVLIIVGMTEMWQYDQFCAYNSIINQNAEFLMITEVEIKTTPLCSSPCTAFSHVALVTYLKRDLQERLQANRQLVQLVSADLQRFKCQIEATQDQIQSTSLQQLSSLKQYLQSITEQQTIENDRLQDEITSAKKQNIVLNQLIASTSRRIVDLKENVGRFQ